MSERFPGGFITNNPTAPTTTSAPGIWTLDQATQYIKAGTWPYGGPFNYIEDVFSTWLYTGTGAAQTITNGIDLSTYGGLVWIKSRSTTYNNYLQDTTRGIQNTLVSNDTSAQSVGNDIVDSVSTSGFVASLYNGGNASGQTYASWTFRKQPKFFDVVTWTGDGVDGRAISHSLASSPGCIIIKRTDASTVWLVNHVGLSGGITGSRIFLEQTAAQQVGTSNVTAVSSTTFTVTATGTNASGGTYVAYLFAHNAGGFGLTGTDNVISCGSFTVNGSGDCSVSLGYEPQWLMVKSSTAIDNWYLYDNMRGFPVAPSDGELLRPNTSQAGITASTFRPTSTGFVGSPGTGFGTGIYIAIRRGPMKTPTSGTSVYNATTWTGNNTTGRTLATGLSSPPDLAITQWRNGLQANLWWDMLRGFSTTAGDNSVYLRSPNTDAELPQANYFYRPDMVNVGFGSIASSGVQLNGSSSTLVGWFLRRAPGFFDEVCYTGTGVNGQTYSHNLGVTPEMMIVKRRESAGFEWDVWHKDLPTPTTAYLWLNSTAAVANSSSEFGALPTASVFSVGNSSRTNAGTSATYVNYLFASCPGVSKVGSYTGTGATQTINCGFTGGARWVMIKRTDSTGDWYVWDTARGMVSGTDPSLLLNSTAAEVNANSVYTTSVGFQIVSTAAGINASGGSYIFLAIA